MLRENDPEKSFLKTINKTIAKEIPVEKYAGKMEPLRFIWRVSKNENHQFALVLPKGECLSCFDNLRANGNAKLAFGMQKAPLCAPCSIVKNTES